MTSPARAARGRRVGYGALLRTPGAWRFLIPGFLARQPIAMLGVGTVLLVEHTTGSYGAAGTVTAVTGISMAVLAPQGGKLTDRFGQGAVLVPLVVLHALSVSALVVLALRGAPQWALLTAAVPAGASIPQISPMVRARWSACLTGDEERPGAGGFGEAGGDPAADDPAEAGDTGRAGDGATGSGETGTAGDGAGEVAGGARASGDGTGRSGPGQAGAGSSLITTAAAFESVTDEFSFVVGPVLATALCTGVHPAAGLVAEVALMLVSGLLFAAQRGTQPPVRTPRGRHPQKTAGPHGSGRAHGSGRDAGQVQGTDRVRNADRREELCEIEAPGRALSSGAAVDGGGAGGTRVGLAGARSRTGGGTPGGQRSALGVRGVPVLIAVLFGVGTVFGGMQVSVAAVTEAAGAPEFNGVLYGVFAAGNMSAALAVGTVRWRRSADVRLLIAYPLLVLAALTLAVAAQLAPWLPLLGGLGLLLGLWIAPAVIAGFTLVELLVPAAYRTEAFTWLTGAVALGQALGSMGAGELADAAGAGTGFFAPLAGTGLALTALVALRRRLVVREGEPPSGGGVRHRPPASVD